MVIYLQQRSMKSRLPARTWPETAARSLTRRQTLNDDYNSHKYKVSLQEEVVCVRERETHSTDRSKIKGKNQQSVLIRY